MKLVIAMLTLFCVQAAAKGFSQNKVTISANKTAIREIFKSIEKQTDYRFLYHESNRLNNVKVSLDVKNMEVPDLLEQLLKNTAYSYRITTGKLILLSSTAAVFE
ncbi:MAG TPA: STN domain-containing protein, partial [Niabella sp.]